MKRWPQRIVLMVLAAFFFSQPLLKAQAPSSIAGQAVVLTIANGSYPFATSGQYRFLASATDSTYGVIKLSGTVADSYGTITSYASNGATATVKFTDYNLGFPSVATLTFNSSGTGGNYTLTSPSAPSASQSGSFIAYTGPAPASVQGWTFQVQVDYGVYPYATSGEAQLTTAASGNSYIINGEGGVSNSYGTYVYTTYPQISPSTTSLTLNDDVLGSEYTQTLSWQTTTSGAYVVRNTSTGGFQAGTFTGTPPSYTVTPSTGANGSISPNTVQTIVGGGSVGFTATPNTGYAVYQWLLNGAIVQTGGTSYTASDVTANASVQVTFQVIPVINSATTASGTYGSLFGGYTITATGSPTSFNATGLPTGLSINTTTGLISGTPTQTGTFNVSLSATNAITGTATLTLTIKNGVGFSQWEANYSFSGAATDIPQNDGVPNLLKYLYDIDPSVPMSATDHVALAAVGTTASGGTPYLTLTYREYAGMTGVTINVQTSSDLRNWTTLTQTTTNPPPANTYTLQSVRTDSNTGDPIMQAQVAITGTKQFIRLNVTTP